MRFNQCAFANFILWVLVAFQAVLFHGEILGSYGVSLGRDNSEELQEPWSWDTRSSLEHHVPLSNTSASNSTTRSSEPHIAWFEYDARTGIHSWHPSWIGNISTSTTGNRQSQKRRTFHRSMDKEQRMQLIEESFLRNNHPHNDNHNTHESQLALSLPVQMLGFIRIPKTGSTAMLTWAEHATRRGPYWSCFFGAPHHDIFTDSDRVSGGLYWNGSNVLDCPHRTYEATVMNWATTVLPQLNFHPTNITAATPSFTVTQRQRQQVSLQLFTILRDPFDRLVSYFHYVRRIYPAWSYVSTPEQNETILANNLSGWMELLATQPPKAFHLPYQKGAMIDIEDFSGALKVIQSPTPRVYTVIQECFEASILLLTEKFPQFFSVQATTNFLNSSKTTQNHKGRFQKVDQDTLTKLKERAKVWFAADFEFYQEAVLQFRDQLIASNVDQTIVQECFNRLAKRQSEPVSIER